MALNRSWRASWERRGASTARAHDTFTRPIHLNLREADEKDQLEVKTVKLPMGIHPNMTREHTVSNWTAVRRDAGFEGPALALLTVMMVILIAVIVCGNALVIVAFKMDKSLRKQSNYFLLNLAISDFLVGK